MTFYLVPKMRRSTFHSDVRRAGRAVTPRLLHHKQGVALLHHLRPPCVPQLMHCVAGLAVGVEECGRPTKMACEHHRSIPGQE